MSLHDALQELSEPFLSPTGAESEGWRSIVDSARAKLQLPETAEPASDPPARRAQAQALREQLLGVAGEVNAVLEAAVAAETLRLAPLALTLDWLVNAPAEQSLHRQLALIAQAESVGQRVGEVSGHLGAVRLEMLALEGRALPQRDAVLAEMAAVLEPLVRVRLVRTACTVDRWLATRAEGA